MEKDASEEKTRIQKKYYKAKKWIEATDDKNVTDGFEMKNISYLGKNYNLFIHKEDKTTRTPPDTVAGLYVIPILAGNIWEIQAKKMW